MTCLRTAIAFVLLGTLFAPLRPTSAGTAPGEVEQLKKEIQRLREENDRNRQRMDDLQRRVDELAAPQAAKPAVKEEKVVEEATPRRYLERYWGDNRFVITGYGSGTYEWHDNANSNTFTAAFAPIFLFRVTDRILFEAEPEFELQDDGGTEINLEYAQADIFLNDYLTFVGGKFLLPFGDFIQQQHPAWINKLVSFPLPFRENEEGGLLPFSDVGAQLRGGLRLFDQEGVDLEYTAYVSNGPRFESDEVGALFESNNVDFNRGKGFGARVAVYPLPLARDIGRLKLGTSTYDGIWDEGSDLWFTSWGIDATYQLAELELRGEYLRTLREMPGDVNSDKREGWYVQAAYKLTRVPVPAFTRVELVARYSGLNQRAVPEDDDQLLPHPRQVALGVDYWITPSVVGKLEYDRELPRDAPNDNAIRAQIAVGF